MRPVRLAQAAAQSEWLRIRLRLRRSVVRAAFFAAAIGFFLAALTAGHVAAWIALQPKLTPLLATAVVGGADLVLALILLGLSSRDRPSAAELEAAQMGRTARAALAREFMFYSSLRTVFSMWRRRR